MILQGTLRLRDDQSYGIRVSVQDVPKVATMTVPILGRIPLDITVQSMRMVMYGRVGQTGPKGFFFNPARCVPATTVVSAEAWDGQRASGRATYTPTNCGGVPFSPRVDFAPQPAAAATPTPLSVKVSQPIDLQGAKMGASIRDTTLILPDGVQLSGAANSDGACRTAPTRSSMSPGSPRPSAQRARRSARWRSILRSWAWCRAACTSRSRRAARTISCACSSWPRPGRRSTRCA